jgi:hypothetical protein
MKRALVLEVVMNPRLPPVARALLVVIAAVGLQALLVPLFAAPNAKLTPHHLPIVVAGPRAATGALAARLRAASPGGFDIRQLPDQAAADNALRHREAYAAIILDPPGPRLHVAGAASQSAASLLAQEQTRLFGGVPLPVLDVVPPPPGDRHGTAYTLGFLPLALAGSTGGAALVLLVRSRPARLVGLIAFGVLAGLIGGVVVRYWLHLVDGHYLPAAMTLGLVTLAVSAAVTGLGSVIGRAGISLGALIVFLVGNALSGISSAPQFLPSPWGTVGQFLPPGAGGTLLRSVAAFHGYGATRSIWVLVGWVVISLALVAARRPATAG